MFRMGLSGISDRSMVEGSKDCRNWCHWLFLLSVYCRLLAALKINFLTCFFFFCTRSLQYLSDINVFFLFILPSPLYSSSPLWLFLSFRPCCSSSSSSSPPPHLLLLLFIVSSSSASSSPFSPLDLSWISFHSWWSLRGHSHVASMTFTFISTHSFSLISNHLTFLPLRLINHAHFTNELNTPSPIITKISQDRLHHCYRHSQITSQR